MDHVRVLEAQLLWDEYKYRHDHVWQTVFRLTAAAVIMSVLPYLHREIVIELGYWVIGPPVLSIVLLVFGFVRVSEELALFDLIKATHREWQNERYQFFPDSAQNAAAAKGFNIHVKLYLGLLLGLTVVNAGVLMWVWVPQVTGRG